MQAQIYDDTVKHAKEGYLYRAAPDAAAHHLTVNSKQSRDRRLSDF